MILGDACGACNAARMQVHVVLRDAISRQRAQGGKVLRQTNNGHDASQLRGVGRTE